MMEKIADYYEVISSYKGSPMVCGIDIVSMSAVQCDSHSHTELGTLGMYLV